MSEVSRRTPVIMKGLESSNYDNAHKLLKQKICVEFIKTTMSSSLINGTLIKRGNKYNATADIAGRHISFSAILNSDCHTMSRIQK
uniref:Uncharacterized protein n=1 Tax=Strongyloides venezuelensis TaxID=75913 RepID=A0A0K0FRR3_STRVS